ncbi:MAG: helix-turn-helix transcriptional regulator [Rickettsiales bacterium]|jgi:transcriptional regulator with XRE-family HTH domain|nr:helix-turn-helix transcriptional regulator [Rickettsiales bacterium]
MKTTTKSIFNPKYKRLIDDMVDARKKKGWSQRELAKQAGVSHCFIGRMETRERRLDVIEAVEIMKLLGLSRSMILKKVSELL